MDNETKTTGGGGGYPGSFSTSRFLLDPAADNGSGLGSGGGGGPVETPAETPNENPRAAADLSGLTPEELSAVPDLYAGTGENAPATPAATPTPTDPNLAANANRTPAAAAATPAAATIRDAARQYGFNLDQYGDDNAAFYALVQAAQRGQQDDFYARLGRQVAPQAQQYQQFLATQRQPSAAPERPAYLPPEFEEGWLNFVDKDEATGTFKAKPGIDPAYADKVNAYADWMGKFQRNPTTFIQPLVQDEARRIAAEVVRDTLARQQQQVTVQSIVEQNGAWMYQANEQGQRYVDARGQFIPTPAGTRYMQHVAALGQAGIKDPAILDRTAQQLVRAEFLGQQAAPATPAAPAATPPSSPQTRQAVGRPQVNPGQAVHPSRRAAVPGSTPADQEGLSLTERLRLAMEAEGVTDQDVFSSAGYAN